MKVEISVDDFIEWLREEMKKLSEEIKGQIESNNFGEAAETYGRYSSMEFFLDCLTDEDFAKDYDCGWVKRKEG